VGEFKEQALANTVWAFAKAGHKAPALFDAIAREAPGRVAKFDPQTLSNTAWAFAEAGHKAPALFEAVGKDAHGRLGEFTEQALSNTAWAFAVLDVRCDALFASQEFVRQCEKRAQALIRKKRGLPQLHRWRLWRDECCEAGHAWPTLSAALLEECERAEAQTSAERRVRGSGD
jgi:hypothetical protein